MARSEAFLLLLQGLIQLHNTPPRDRQKKKYLSVLERLHDSEQEVSRDEIEFLNQLSQDLYRVDQL